jgi:hypothetical protein
VDLELGRVLDGEILAEPGDGRRRIALEFHLEAGALVLKHSARLDLFGEEWRHGRFLFSSEKNGLKINFVKNIIF